MSLRVLLIGAEKYNEPTLPPLPGVATDLSLWFGYAAFRLGVPPADIRVLGDVTPAQLLGHLGDPSTFPPISIRPATRSEILDGFEWLMTAIERGQRGLLTYSGYGTLLPPVKRPREVRPTARVRAICPIDITLSCPRPAEGEHDSDTKAPARVLVEGAIPLPDHSLRGVPLPAGNALDRALSRQGKAHHKLTMVLDTSFNTFTQPPRTPSRSLPVITERAPCLPVYDLASRTICAARPGEDAVELDLFEPSSGALTFSMLYPLRNVHDAETASSGERYSKVTHQTLHDEVRQAFLDSSLPQHATFAGVSTLPLLSFLSPGIGCGFRDGDRRSSHALDNTGQIHPGINGFRGYILQGEIVPPAGGPPSWLTVGYILSAGAPVFGQLVGSQPDLWPRAYDGQKEYWRTIDPAITELFSAKQQGRLRAVRIVLKEQRYWDEAPSHAAVAWVRNTAEASTRKRHCDVYPAWNDTQLVPLDGPNDIVLRATLNGDDVCVRLVQDGGHPGILERVVWYHGRHSKMPSPTFFGHLPQTGQVFAVVPGHRPPPHGRAAWWCADTPMAKLPADP